MTRVRRRPLSARRLLVGALAALLIAVVATGCAGESEEPAPAAGPASGSPSDPPAGSASDDASEPPSDPACEPGEGREVELLEDIEIPAVDVPAVTDPESGAELVPATTIPAQVVDAGCIVRHDAPGGCLGAVDVSAVTIPAVTIPGAEIDDRSYPPVTVAAVSRPAVHTDEVCQVTRDDDVLGVTRAGVVREGFSRPGAARPGDDLVPTVTIEPVQVPAVDIEPERLDRRELPGADLAAFDDGERTSYVAPAKVLFDTDEYVLRPDAVAALREIAGRIRRDEPRRILVEGHTDDRGDEQYGQMLSERRAAAVADWLVRSGGLPRARIVTTGYGETRPAYPNDSEANRQRNRRVVITAIQ